MTQTFIDDLHGVQNRSSSRRTLRGLSASAQEPATFRTGTGIQFTLAERGRVRLAIYDVSGRVVKRLLDEERPAGRHQVEWTGAGDDGARARPGVYFYRIVIEPAGSGPGFSALRKMVLLGSWCPGATLVLGAGAVRPPLPHSACRLSAGGLRRVSWRS